MKFRDILLAEAKKPIGITGYGVDADIAHLTGMYGNYRDSRRRPEGELVSRAHKQGFMRGVSGGEAGHGLVADKHVKSFDAGEKHGREVRKSVGEKNVPSYILKKKTNSYGETRVTKNPEFASFVEKHYKALAEEALKESWPDKHDPDFEHHSTLGKWKGAVKKHYGSRVYFDSAVGGFGDEHHNAYDDENGRKLGEFKTGKKAGWVEKPLSESLLESHEYKTMTHEEHSSHIDKAYDGDNVVIRHEHNPWGGETSHVHHFVLDKKSQKLVGHLVHEFHDSGEETHSGFMKE